MRMGVEQKGDLLSTIENFGLIKLFFDSGVNVEKFPDYEVSVRHGVDEGNYIFEVGISKLFGDCTLIYEGDNEEDDAILARIKELGELKYKHEFAYIIPLNIAYSTLDELKMVIEKCNKDEKYEHGKFIIDFEKNDLYIPLEHMGGLSETAKRLICLKQFFSKQQ